MSLDSDLIIDPLDHHYRPSLYSDKSSRLDRKDRVKRKDNGRRKNKNRMSENQKKRLQLKLSQKLFNKCISQIKTDAKHVKIDYIEMTQIEESIQST